MEESKKIVLSSMGSSAHIVRSWIEGFVTKSSLYNELASQPEACARVSKTASWAPVLLNKVQSESLAQLLISGELEMGEPIVQSLEELAIDTSLSTLALAMLEGWTKLLLRWHLGGGFDLRPYLTALVDSWVIHLVNRTKGRFEAIGLGSFGRMEMSVGSDIDLLLLVPTDEDCEDGERGSADLLNTANTLRQLGVPISLDLRLRPRNIGGPLVRSYEMFRTYDLEGMQLWERYAIGLARPVNASQEAMELVKKVAYADPLTPENLKKLLATKKLLENEQLDERHKMRHIKLGIGGLSDIEWLVHLAEIRLGRARTYTLDDRVSDLARSGFFNTVESDILREALIHLYNIRVRLQLMGIDSENIPENPDKLDYLAHCEGDADGNAWLARHEEMRHRVRGIYEEGMARLAN